jgi:hypothetical protein
VTTGSEGFTSITRRMILSERRSHSNQNLKEELKGKGYQREREREREIAVVL